MLKKNDVVSMEITDITNEAKGVGHIDGMAVFVPNTAVGDVIDATVTKVNKHYAFAKCLNIKTKSPDRCKPNCNVYKKCGGCQLMHLSYDAQLRLKESFIRNALVRLGGVKDDFKIDMIGADNRFNYRNKMVFPVGKSKNGKTVCGFYEQKSHNVVPLDDCMLGIVPSKNIIKAVLDYMDKYHILPYDENAHSGLVRRIFVRHGVHTNETMIVISVNGDSIPHGDELVNALKSSVKNVKSIVLNINKQKSNVVLGNKNITLWGESVIYDTLCGNTYEISPNSFFQVNPYQTEKLYNRALEYADIQPDDIVMDVYCGIGTISLAAAKTAKTVTGIEVVADAIENAKINAKNNGITNSEFFVGIAEDVVPKLLENNLKPNKVILDPPRKGSDEKTLTAICSASPSKIVYVSCNPSTLARDVKFLMENGYKLEKVSGVDMFANTVHIECVVLLSRA